MMLKEISPADRHMKPRVASNMKRGFTRRDLLIVVISIGLLAALLLPSVASSRAKSKRIRCVCRLKQIGLALRMWSNECSEKFPWQVSTHAGGTAESLGPADAYHHFRAASNELSSPKILACPSDRIRRSVERWKDFISNSHLSYFVGLDGTETRPQTILSGDRNLLTNSEPARGLVGLTATTRMEWSREIHNRQGDICLGDGSVQQLTIAGMKKQVEAAIASETNRTMIRLLVP